MSPFKTSFAVYDVWGMEWIEPASTEREDQAPSEIEILSRALVTGIREYFTSPNNHYVITGPNGVPRTSTALAPGSHSLPRTTTTWDAQPVGRLLARTTSEAAETVTHAYTPGCSVRVPTQQPFVRFAPNDSVASFLGDRHHVRALFLSMNGILASFATPCANNGTLVFEL